MQDAHRRRLSLPAARFYAASVLLVLEHLHARGVIYRRATSPLLHIAWPAAPRTPAACPLP